MMEQDFRTYLDKLYDADSPGFRFTVKGHSTLLSTCFGIQLGYLTNILENINIEDIAAEIKAQQRIDGIFIDKHLSELDLSGSHSLEYLFHCRPFVQ